MCVCVCLCVVSIPSTYLCEHSISRSCLYANHTSTFISCMKYTGLFSYIQVSFHIYRSLLTHLIHRAIHTSTCIMHITYTGLFSHTQVSFHIYRSLLTRLIHISSRNSYLHMFHAYRIHRSLFTNTGLFSHIYVCFDTH